MSSERAVKAKIRAAVKGRCHIQSMSSYATNGTPDLWLSGRFGDMWLEVKYDPKATIKSTPKLSTLQRKWLHDRQIENRETLVYLATSLKEGILFTNTVSYNEESRQLVTFEELIDYIFSRI